MALLQPSLHSRLFRNILESPHPGQEPTINKHTALSVKRNNNIFTKIRPKQWYKRLSTELIFLPRDATQSEVMLREVVRLSLRLFVTFRYRDHTRWNSSKTISRPKRLRPLLRVAPNWAIWYNDNIPKIGVNTRGITQ